MRHVDYTQHTCHQLLQRITERWTGRWQQAHNNSNAAGQRIIILCFFIFYESTLSMGALGLPPSFMYTSLLILAT